MERLPDWQIALRRLDMDPSRYLFIYVGAASLMGFVTGALLMFLGLFTGFFGVLVTLVFTVISAGAAIVFPLLEVRKSANKIEKEMHMFVTRMGILSLGEVGARSMFDILRQMGDYGELAQEVKRIETLVDKWHTALPEASRIVGQQSPSPLFADFLDRMAFSIEAGQPIDIFMKAEQETIAEEYNTLYDMRLESVDSLRDIFVSLSTAGLFALVVAGIHLVLFQTGTLEDESIIVLSRIRFLIMSAFFFILIQAGCMFGFRAIIPDDPVFSRDDFETPYRLLFGRAWVYSGIAMIVVAIPSFLGIFIFWEDITAEWDKYALFLVAIPLTPLLFPGIIEQREEGLVKKRDYMYPGFIRALGGTAQARSAEPSATIKALRGIDFGRLDECISRLESRLSTRIDSERAWDYFSAETNSAVISRFNRIYIEGAQSSGEPAATADMVSKSTTNMLSLRRRRGLSASTMWGTSLGLLIATITSLNITIYIVRGLGESISGVASGLTDIDLSSVTEGAAGFGLPALDDNTVIEQNIYLFKVVISILIILQILIMSAIGNRLRGGGWSTTIGQGVQMLWLSAIVSFITSLILDWSSGLFGIGS
ncbi:MAG: hypothetical protein CMB48_01870 [Euryarchaeota archaeon]|nr:hypothetical protein [Euryarchaeota archaeon]|tara:strand:+ start:878 stop:2665 length:1788 start_codon:yes stop_codon:yes gene_type:complete